MLIVAFIVFVVACAVFALVPIVRAYPTFARVERIALWWWFAVALLAFIGVVGQLYVVVACAGILMVPLGLFVALDVHGVADRLGARRMGIGPFWAQQSAAYWRVSGAGLVVIGAFWIVVALQVAD